jgi:hypothetical protein
MVDLDPYDYSTSVSGINDLGIIVGTSGLNAYFWHDNQMNGLYNTNGTTNNSANAINEHCTVVGSASTGDGNMDAVLWHAACNSSFRQIAIESITPSDNPIQAGASLQINAVFFDNINSDYTAILDWGDKYTDNGIVSKDTYGGGSITGAHVYYQPGTYTVKLTVTDVSDATSAETTIENLVVLPNEHRIQIDRISVPVDLIPVGTQIQASANFTDNYASAIHDTEWFWGDVGSDGQSMDDTNGITTSEHTYHLPGVYRIQLRVYDSRDGAFAEALSQYLVVYDPNGGSVTGAGWINSPAGAYLPDPQLTGRAVFGFASKYKPGASKPSGATAFEFRAGKLSFVSATNDWLAVGGSRAQYQGTGILNGVHGYHFSLTVLDVQAGAGGEGDQFRMRIWTTDANGDEQVVYDNGLGASMADNPNTVIGGGAISIHN